MDALTSHYEHNADKIKKIFHYPENVSLVVRNVYISFLNKESVIIYVEEGVDVKEVEERVVEPLTGDTTRTQHDESIATFLLQEVLTIGSGNKISKISEAVDEINNGNTVIFIEDEREAIAVSTASLKARSIPEATTEVVIKGPKEAFNESVSTNRSLIRKRLRDTNLICEVVTVGEREPRNISLMYVKDIANDDLVKKVKKRLNDINIDTILDLTLLEPFLEEKPYSLIPETLATERPDRTASFLRDGHVVLLMEGSPLAIVVPVTFWMLFQTPEDQYLRWIAGNFIRMIRLLGLFITLLVPAMYVAVTTFHPEMLPTDLMLAIAASRERIPFPSLWELLIMEFTFEILREAGIRIPTVIGPTIGIVGAIILGQAAVQANIVSPILVVIVAITGLASFTIPDVSFNISVRITRFIFLLAAAFMGFFGLSLCFVVFLAYAASHSSFNVPFFAPVAPALPSSKDTYFRSPVSKQWLRPYYLFPKDKQRMSKPGGQKK